MTVRPTAPDWQAEGLDEEGEVGAGDFAFAAGVFAGGFHIYASCFVRRHPLCVVTGVARVAPEGGFGFQQRPEAQGGLWTVAVTP